MSDANWSPRRSERLKVTLHAGISSQDSSQRGVTLVNITPKGCCVTTGGMIVQPGSAVLVRLESGDSLSGRVRWFDGTSAGLAFEHIQPVPRVEYLRHEHTSSLAESDPMAGKVQRSVC